MHIEPELKDKVERFFEQAQPNMGHTLEIEFLSLTKDEVIASMPVNENTIQPFGILHGGASVALAETAASFGAWLNVAEESKTAVGIEINANHVRGVSMGERVIGTATPVHKGSRIQVWEIRIETESGKLVCSSRCTLAIVDRK